MAETNFEQGDVVTITAGESYSPRMVVKYVDGDHCICIWYNGTTRQFEEYRFPNPTLTKLG